jgi:aminoglycoside/choline kinase family phosphotransferase
MSATGRACKIADFLAAQGWAMGKRTPLAGDASFRRYERLTRGSDRAVLMDAAPPQENVRPFIAIDRLLAGAGLAVPKIYGADEEAGLLLLEDMGDDTYTRLLARGESQTPLYELAIDLLIELHRRLPPEKLAGVPAFEDDMAMRQVTLLLEWYWPATQASAAPPAAVAAFEAAWRVVLALWRRSARGLVLFDYHVDNLMLLAGRSGIASVGLLDFQDAVVGSRSFDLVSLIDDARRDVPADLAAALTARYLAAFPGLDRAAFAAAYAASGAQRHTRILGTFTRLCRRDGKPAYLAFIPRVWRQLEACLGHPDLAPLAEWFARYLPPERRIVPLVQRP